MESTLLEDVQSLFNFAGKIKISNMLIYLHYLALEDNNKNAE